MKFTVKKEALVNAVNIAIRAVSQKNNLSILECILISADEEEISIYSNDQELAIKTNLQKEGFNIEESGRSAIDAKLFSDIIRKITGEDENEIEISSNGSIMELKSGNSKFEISERDYETFPSLPEVDSENYIALSQFTLKELIRNTIFSIIQNDSNKMMSGEYFEVKNNRLRLASLDGHRISVRRTVLNGEYNDISAVIPGKTLNELMKILPGEAEKEVDIFFSEKHAMFTFDSNTVVTRLIEGEYFNIDSMLSSDYETKITVSRREMYEVLERASILVRESEKKPIIIKIQEEIAEMKIKTGMGSMDDSIQVEKEGKDLIIGFNPKFLSDALRAIEDENVDFYMTNSKAPCYIRDEDESYIYLILPVNFNPASYY